MTRQWLAGLVTGMYLMAGFTATLMTFWNRDKRPAEGDAARQNPLRPTPTPRQWVSSAQSLTAPYTPPTPSPWAAAHPYARPTHIVRHTMMAY